MNIIYLVFQYVNFSLSISMYSLFCSSAALNFHRPGPFFAFRLLKRVKEIRL